VPRNDQIIRILSVARALAESRRGVSLKELAKRHGWHWRTVYRDKDALEAAGFPVENIEGRFRLPRDWAVPKLPGIEADELLALFTLRALVGAWRGTALVRPLDRLWGKLASSGSGQSALLPVGREPWLTVRSPFAIDYHAHDKTIATFEKAAKEQLVVNCRYRALSTRRLTARQIEPSELYWDPALESLYVFGWCRLRQDVRVFAMHRFAAASLTEARFKPRVEARSKAVLKNAFRIWRGKNIETVRVRFSPEVAEEIRERTWAPGQKIEEEPGGGLVLTLEVAGLAEVERWVLGFGEGAEVVAPGGLRRNVENVLKRAAAIYVNRKVDHDAIGA
jgi:predicted DNA-binding transcriptional regulator YafY